MKELKILADSPIDSRSQEQAKSLKTGSFLKKVEVEMAPTHLRYFPENREVFVNQTRHYYFFCSFFLAIPFIYFEQWSLLCLTLFHGVFLLLGGHFFLNGHKRSALFWTLAVAIAFPALLKFFSGHSLSAQFLYIPIAALFYKNFASRWSRSMFCGLLLFAFVLVSWSKGPVLGADLAYTESFYGNIMLFGACLGTLLYSIKPESRLVYDLKTPELEAPKDDHKMAA